LILLGKGLAPDVVGKLVSLCFYFKSLPERSSQNLVIGRPYAGDVCPVNLYGLMASCADLADIACLPWNPVNRGIRRLLIAFNFRQPCPVHRYSGLRSRFSNLWKMER
jgi:hypothetical protein